jgi:hypothetical protein
VEEECVGEKDRNRERERSFDNHEVTEDDDDVFDLFFQKQQRMVSTTPCRVTAPLGERAPVLTASTLYPHKPFGGESYGTPVGEKEKERRV